MPIDGAIEGGPLERPYLIGFWREAVVAIKRKFDPPLDEKGGWNGVIQKIEARVREVQSAPTGERVSMQDITDNINELVDESSNTTVRVVLPE